MEFQFYGANCIKITSRKTSIVVDDDLKSHGHKPVAGPKDIVLMTHSNVEAPAESVFTVDQPGEYEVSDVSIQGIAARSHMDEEGKNSATMYLIILDGMRIGIVGHVHPDLKESELEALGTIDVLFVPVGGNGYTLDGVGAHKVVKDVEPKLVIPSHYDDGKTKYEVPQTPLEDALKAVAIEPTDRVDVLKMKNVELAEGAAKLIVVNPS